MTYHLKMKVKEKKAETEASEVEVKRKLINTWTIKRYGQIFKKRYYHVTTEERIDDSSFT